MENQVVRLCNRFDPNEIRPFICSLDQENELVDRVDSSRVTMLAVPRWIGNDPTVPFRLALQLWRNRIDILHTHSWGTLVEGIVAAKLANTAAVIHGEHGTIEQRARNVRVQRMMWPRTARVLAVSTSLADKLAHRIGFPHDQITVISNGVDADLFQPPTRSSDALKRKFSLPSNELLIGTIGRLVPVKNHACLLEAMAKVRSSGIAAHLAIAGDGPLETTLRKLATELRIGPHVSFLGSISCVPECLNALDLFVLSSLSEGMSNTILEAMASGLPVVATAVGSNPQLVNDGVTGRLVPTDDCEALSECLIQLADQPDLRANMGRAGRQRVKAEFDFDQSLARYTKLYHEVLDQQTSRRNVGRQRISTGTLFPPEFKPCQTTHQPIEPEIS